MGIINKGLCKAIALVLLATSLTHCAKTPDSGIDPLERINRPIFVFNETLDKILLKPTAHLYRRVAPWPVRQGIGNFFGNLSELPTLANDILQGEFHLAADAAGRFLVNSSLGIAGIFDVASQRGIPQHSQDFGITLAKWGVVDSPYLVLPLFGPSTIRDTVGWAVDYFFTVYPYLNNRVVGYSMFGLNVIHRRSELLEADAIIQSASLDHYTFQRNAYLQHRNAQFQRNTLEEDDPYIDEIDEEEEQVIEEEIIDDLLRSENDSLLFAMSPIAPPVQPTELAKLTAEIKADLAQEQP